MILSLLVFAVLLLAADSLRDCNYESEQYKTVETSLRINSNVMLDNHMGRVPYVLPVCLPISRSSRSPSEAPVYECKPGYYYNKIRKECKNIPLMRNNMEQNSNEDDGTDDGYKPILRNVEDLRSNHIKDTDGNDIKDTNINDNRDTKSIDNRYTNNNYNRDTNSNENTDLNSNDYRELRNINVRNINSIHDRDTEVSHSSNNRGTKSIVSLDTNSNDNEERKRFHANTIIINEVKKMETDNMNTKNSLSTIQENKHSRTNEYKDSISHTSSNTNVNSNGDKSIIILEGDLNSKHINDNVNGYKNTFDKDKSKSYVSDNENSHKNNYENGMNNIVSKIKDSKNKSNTNVNMNEDMALHEYLDNDESHSIKPDTLRNGLDKNKKNLQIMVQGEEIKQISNPKIGHQTEVDVKSKSKNKDRIYDKFLKNKKVKSQIKTNIKKPQGEGSDSGSSQDVSGNNKIKKKIKYSSEESSNESLDSSSNEANNKRAAVPTIVIVPNMKAPYYPPLPMQREVPEISPLGKAPLYSPDMVQVPYGNGNKISPVVQIYKSPQFKDIQEPLDPSDIRLQVPSIHGSKLLFKPHQKTTMPMYRIATKRDKHVTEKYYPFLQKVDVNMELNDSGFRHREKRKKTTTKSETISTTLSSKSKTITVKSVTHNPKKVMTTNYKSSKFASGSTKAVPVKTTRKMIADSSSVGTTFRSTTAIKTTTDSSVKTSATMTEVSKITTKMFETKSTAGRSDNFNNTTISTLNESPVSKINKYGSPNFKHKVPIIPRPIIKNIKVGTIFRHSINNLKIKINHKHDKKYKNLYNQPVQQVIKEKTHVKVNTSVPEKTFKSLVVSNKSYLVPSEDEIDFEQKILHHNSTFRSDKSNDNVFSKSGKDFYTYLLNKTDEIVIKRLINHAINDDILNVRISEDRMIEEIEEEIRQVASKKSTTNFPSFEKQLMSAVTYGIPRQLLANRSNTNTLKMFTIPKEHHTLANSSPSFNTRFNWNYVSLPGNMSKSGKTVLGKNDPFLQKSLLPTLLRPVNRKHIHFHKQILSQNSSFSKIAELIGTDPLIITKKNHIVFKSKYVGPKERKSENSNDLRNWSYARYHKTFPNTKMKELVKTESNHYKNFGIFDESSALTFNVTSNEHKSERDTSIPRLPKERALANSSKVRIEDYYPLMSEIKPLKYIYKTVYGTDLFLHNFKQAYRSVRQVYLLTHGYKKTNRLSKFRKTNKKKLELVKLRSKKSKIKKTTRIRKQSHSKRKNFRKKSHFSGKKNI